MPYKRDGGKILIGVGALLLVVSIFLYFDPGYFVGEFLEDYRMGFLVSLLIGALLLSYGLVLKKTAK